jgi:antitoxin component YwqK of YwqJK toxin-antitoxin module
MSKVTFSKLVKEIFNETEEFIFSGNVVNGHLEGDCR